MHTSMEAAQPGHQCRLLVYHDHRLVGDWPDSYDFTHEGQVLVILDDDHPRRPVWRYAEGEWSGAGVDIHCAFHRDDPECATCHPQQPGGEGGSIA